MIEPHAPAPPGAPPPWGVQGQARLPVRPGVGRFLVLAGVFVCAACGLVYELELVALASYLIGDSVTQASVVLSVMVFAMGVGSLAAKRLRPRAAAGFGAVEAALALVGGCSAMALYAVFAWTGGWGGLWADGSRWLLVAFSLAIGLLIGAEVPLLMELIQRIRRQDPGGAVADLFAADYVGALVGGLAFPFLLLPLLGQLTGALLTGTVNAVAGGALVLGLFRKDLTRRARWTLLVANVVVLGLLASAAVLVDDFERAARHAVYGGDVRVALRSGVQEVVLAGGTRGHPLHLFLDGRLRFSGHDEHRYHEALVHPAMNGPHARVLILGGGDGLAAREVLRHPGVRRVDVVEIDADVVRLARHDAALTALNHHAYDDPRVHEVTEDAFTWLRGAASTYDVVVSDLPDPGITASTKLYSQEFYGLARRVLAPGGRLVVHAGPLDGRQRVFWTVEATLRAAGLRTTPYRVAGRDSGFAAGPDRTTGGSVGAPGDWGFVLAARSAEPLRLPASGPRLRTLTRAALAADARAADRSRPQRPLAPSTLVHPRYSD
ncbi:polyamine aminopropyltransferase [Streptomyces sp. NBC_01281]|uniref:polyamine aminopropyltransferase n=1 Tax=unclassified Streptomyces TaxID=2593676 RepID=UPI0013BDF4BF|nr:MULTISPECIES: polyamine aminopropyltransferase [unclassified Streptomyces]MCX5284602.1 polyamine aminopropyltransferase [Streptomyces sp. NBC_00198]NEB32006.1 polyamine aminopropyltransferase [Streptomyces sp. SID14446]WSD78533.1 polyamine aminopropyltransferase [Streptomyces sp. NBC_01558]WSK62133.1 polyamine aminopropyltransferase [Streptomyces sp. NBC_01281]